MALSISQRLQLLIPSLVGSMAPETQDQYIVMATYEVVPLGATHWTPELRQQAIALLAAHYISLFLNPARAYGAGGSITHKEEGKLMLKFSGSSSSSRLIEDLEQTSFGLRLKHLLASIHTMIEVI